MGCSYAIETDEYHGFECSVSGGACMYLYLDSKRCAREYGEGPDVGNTEIWKNNDTFRRPCHNRHGCAWHQMKKVSLLPEMAAIIKPLRQIFISAAHMEKG